jgi:hypothetical protein
VNARSLPDESDRNTRRYADVTTIRSAIRPDPQSFESRVLTIGYRIFIAIALAFVVCGIVVNAYVHLSGALN